MTISIYTRLGRFIKKIFRIRDVSLFRKNLHKNFWRLFYHKKYTAKELVNLMCEMGMKPGSLICIHSSMKEFYNYQGTAEQLIQTILDVIGPEGTLMMPAFPKKDLVSQKNYVFDVNKDPTGAGFLAEQFRKYPGVKRSINVRHSVCAIGKYADMLIEGHENAHDCWSDGTPWKRLCDMGGLVFNLGLPRSYMGTFHHCIESTLQYEHPYWAQFFNTMVTYRYYDNNHHVKTYTTHEGLLERRTRKKKVTSHFDSNDWKICKISNLEVKVYYLANCFPKMLKLGRKGIGVFYIPSPQEYEF